MDTDTILNILGSGGSELEFLKQNLDHLNGFLAIVDMVDKLPEMDRRVSEDGMSLYHAISKEKDMGVLENTIANFFQEPVKRAGEPLPEHLSDSLTVNSLGGVKTDQTLFLSKIGQSEFFAALFPWQRKVNVITVHLGLYNPVMSDEDYEKLEKLVTETITQRVSEEMEEGLAGQVTGISLPSFLQMSEMEGSTCSLRIRSADNTGMLHLVDGNLIDAETDDLKHKEAAYEIIAWDNPSIEILKAVGRTKNEIQVPLMHLLMDSLRIKDQKEFEKDAQPPEAEQKSEKKKKVQQQQLQDKAPPVEKPVPVKSPEPPVSIKPAKPTVEKKAVEPLPAASKSAAAKPGAPQSQKRQKVESESLDEDVSIHVDSEMQPPTEAAASEAEKKPTKPHLKADETDTTIDDSLIQKEEPEPGQRLRLRKAKAPQAPKKKKLPMAVIAVVVILILCGVGYFIVEKMATTSISDYDRLLKKIERLSEFEAREKLLMDFIDTHEPGEDTAKAEAKLAELWQQNEEDNYQKTIDAVNKLPVDRSFEANAKTLYQKFLEKYPQSQHKREIEQALAEISGLSEDVIFSDLKNISAKEHLKRIRAFENYLGLYPQGKYLAPVKKMFSETLYDAYLDFKSSVTVCERAANWDNCLQICDDYLTGYSKYVDVAEAKRIRARMLMQKEFVDLQVQAEGVDDQAAKDLYLAYIQKYPNSPKNEEIQKVLQRYKEATAAGQQWQALKKYAQRSDVSLQSRIDRLERYLSRTSDGPYTSEARIILDQLENEAEAKYTAQKQALNRKQAEEKAKQEAEEQYAKLMERQAERARIEQEKQRVITSLKQTRGRFTLSGDSAVIDKNTGLMWGLLDSQREIGACMDHRAAKRYVQELRYNGYDDWRLPTSAELASIYKNQPYFPATGADWYWTSEIFAKGYSYIVNTVSAKQESIFKKIPQDVEACGSVRAVRP